MSDWLQLPNEALWLYTTLEVFIRVLKSQWKDGADISTVTARSNWLVDQIDVRGWAHSFGSENGDNLVKTGRGVYIRMLLAPPSGATPEVRDLYWSWVEDRILVPIQEQFPDLYASIVDWHRKQISEIADMEVTQREMT